MKYVLTFFLFLNFNLFSQEKVEPLVVQKSENDPQYSGNVQKTEEEINQNLSKANFAFKGYYNILFMRMNSLPINTTVTRGIANGDECNANPNPDETGNCLKVELYDFIDVETKDSKGAVSKQIILFFDLPPNTKANSSLPTNVNLLKIKSKLLSDNFATLHRANLELIDTDPLGKPAHDEKIFIVNQVDNFPLDKNTVMEGRATMGKYRLNSVENTKSYPTMNKFKQESYVKSLLLFEKLLAKVYYFNEFSGNNKIKADVEFLKKSLQY
jgi:hypothetical protein